MLSCCSFFISFSFVSVLDSVKHHVHIGVSMFTDVRSSRNLFIIVSRQLRSWNIFHLVIFDYLALNPNLGPRAIVLYISETLSYIVSQIEIVRTCSTVLLEIFTSLSSRISSHYSSLVLYFEYKSVTLQSFDS